MKSWIVCTVFCHLLTVDRPSSIIAPTNLHPEVIIAAVAARDPQKAKDYATEHGIAKVYTSYQGKSIGPSK
jgi:predicted dehydrogenase